MDETDLSIDFLLQETFLLTEQMQLEKEVQVEKKKEPSFDELYSLANEVAEVASELPRSTGIVYRIDRGAHTFCVRGAPVLNIKETLENPEFNNFLYFETKTIEQAEAVADQIINRRFPYIEDSLCNLSDPGFSWWLNLEEKSHFGKMEIFFKSYGVNRAEKYIQLGPIGDGSIFSQRMNQARALFSTSFPVSEFSSDERSFVIATTKPDHLGFDSFKDIFLKGINQTTLDNFPDNYAGKTLYYYFHELALIRKFWIEVNSKLC